VKRALVLAAVLTFVPFAAHAKQECIPEKCPGTCWNDFCYEKLPSDDCQITLIEDLDPPKLRHSFAGCPNGLASGGGFSIGLVPAHAFDWTLGDVNAQTSVQPAAGSYQRFRAFGSLVPGGSSVPVSVATVTVTSLGRELTPDFSPVGATTFRVEVMNGTAMVLAANGRSGVGARAANWPDHVTFGRRQYKPLTWVHYPGPQPIQIPGVGSATGDQVIFIAESTQEIAWYDRTESSTYGLHDIGLGPSVTEEAPGVGSPALAALLALALAAAGAWWLARTRAARGARAAALVLVGVAGAGMATSAAARTFVVPHVLETQGRVASVPHAYDTEFMLTYAPGLAGTAAGAGATTALTLYDDSGQLLKSATGEVVCAPCQYSTGTTTSPARRVTISVDDLIMAHGGFGTTSAPKRGFAVLEVTGDPDNLSMESRVEYSEDTPGDISICPKLPRDVLKDYFEPATPRVLTFACLRDRAGNTTTAHNTDLFLHAVYTGGLGSVPAGGGATVELYLYDEQGAPLSSTAGPVCAPCTYALGTGQSTSPVRWLEIVISSLPSMPMDQQGFAVVRLAGPDPGAVVLEGEGESSLTTAAQRFRFGWVYWMPPPMAPALEVSEPDAAGAALLLRSAPNPATGAMRFTFELARAADASVDVFDAAGRRVATVGGGMRAAGRHELAWDRRDDAGRPLQAGIYYGRLRTADGSRITRLVFLP